MKNDRTFLDKLLDGAEVKWKPLEQVIHIANNARKPVKSSLRVAGNIPYYGANNIQDYVEGYTHDGEFVLIAEDGSASLENYSIQWAVGKFWTNNHVHVICSKEELNNRFLYHYLTNMNFIPFLDGKERAKLTKAKLQQIPIPIPPLPVQTEIVRILDTLTALTSEITSELILRQKQYEYYREKLLSFDSLERLNKGWAKEKLIELSEIGSIRMCKRILKNQTSSIGDIPFYKIGTFGKEPDAYISKELFQEYKQKYSYPKKGDILISASGTIGRTVVFDGKDAYFQDSNIVWVENDERIVLNKYLFHFYKIAKWGAAEGGTIQRLYNDNLRKVKIPVPPLEEQHRIVSILDKFETLTNSITEGLPLAIEQSQKRYEYYRELLLSFAKPDN
ncbi:restriction endonuclease subunit S [Aggregatibacter actinomycetemcomitans]|uniref:restriction endonuclease subunit S n=1 Tax=Aggregatibacter actinomycetemcomitans TaxID=714 RepID=UPI00197BB3C6|nr:restriction endonuclease subunit S [Aggregatibacter actinomycetemcomitans]MBN6070398.1 restriction endonuclease subunit S [Aggregatibacter actinomycetemcomitans]